MFIRLFCFILLTTDLQAQQTSIRGLVSIQNSKTVTGKRKFVSNAAVKDDFKSATGTITNNLGEFELIYLGKNPGERISFQVSQEGLQVVNIDALSAITDQKDVVNIYMANPDSIAEYRRSIYNVGISKGEERLKINLKIANGKLSQLKKDTAKNGKEITRLNFEIVTLKNSFYLVDQRAREFAEKYYPINLDDASTIFKNAFAIFQRGELDSAVLFLSNANLEAKVAQILQVRVKNNFLQNELLRRELLEKKTTKETLEALELKADLQISQGRIDSSLQTYLLLINLDSQNIKYLFNCAHLLQALNHNTEAIVYYLKIINSTKFSNKKTSVVEDSTTAAVQNNLGIVYTKNEDYYLSEKAFYNALEIFDSLVKFNFQTYLPNLAAVLGNLGNYYNISANAKKAEFCHLKALKIYNKLFKDDPKDFEPYIAITQNDLGNVYFNNNEYDKAEQAYLKASEIWDGKNQSVKYLPDMGNLNYNMGNIFLFKGENRKSEMCYKLAFDIYEFLAKKNPLLYNYYLGRVQNGLGRYYISNNDALQAKKAFDAALQIIEPLAKSNPKVYGSELENIKNNLALLASLQK